MHSPATELSRFMREPTEPGIIMLAGQGTKVFTVREIVEELFRGIPVIYHFQETAVVHGVGNYVGQLNGFWKGDLLLVDAFPLGIGLMHKPTPPVPRKWRDASDREWEVTPVSGKRTENTDTLELIHNGRTIPMESRNYVEPVNHDGTITLELVQFENLSVSQAQSARPLFRFSLRVTCSRSVLGVMQTARLCSRFAMSGPEKRISFKSQTFSRRADTRPFQSSRLEGRSGLRDAYGAAGCRVLLDKNGLH